MVRPLVYGHRGASADAPENTIEAFSLARAQGADGVELDVRRTRDGAMAVIHDDTLPDGRLVYLTLAADLPDEVPLLDEALDRCAGLVVNVEIKNVPVDPDHDPECRLADRVVDLLASRGWTDDVIVSCFGLRTVDRVHRLAPDLPTAFLTMGTPDAPTVIGLAVDRGHRALHPHDAVVDEALVTAAHAVGLAVNVWTVDDPDRIRALAAMGVDGIVTNVPAVARAALA